MPALASNTQRRLMSVELNTIRAARDWMTSLCGPHELDVKHRGDLLFRHGGAALADMSVGMIQYSTQAQIKTNDLLYSYSISLPIEGMQCLEKQRKEIESTPLKAVIISPGDTVRLTMSSDCRKYLVRISRAALEQRLSALLHRPLHAPVIFEPSMPLEGRTSDWWHLVGQLHSILSQPSSLFDLPEVWQSFQESLITGLLYAQPHNYSQQLEYMRLNRPAYLLDLEKFMHERVGHDLTLEDLERVTGMNRERLYKDFRQAYNSTPMSYFRDLCFQEVRQRLLVAPTNASVSSIALDCGFSQLGRFAHEYQDRFGELPSETLRKRQP